MILRGLDRFIYNPGSDALCLSEDELTMLVDLHDDNSRRVFDLPLPSGLWNFTKALASIDGEAMYRRGVVEGRIVTTRRYDEGAGRAVAVNAAEIRLREGRFLSVESDTPYEERTSVLENAMVFPVRYANSNIDNVRLCRRNENFSLTKSTPVYLSVFDAIRRGTWFKYA